MKRCLILLARFLWADLEWAAREIARGIFVGFGFLAALTFAVKVLWQ